MTIETVITLILSLINGLSIVYFAWKKNKPEVKKLEVESESEIVEAAERNLESAKISNQMLIDRINELKKDLEDEKQTRRDELEAQRISMQSKIDAETEARRKESEYLRRRLKEAEREARDYRSWAANLAKQVVRAGQIPTPFIPSSLEDSDPSLAAMSKETQQKISDKWDERNERNKNDKQ